MPPGPLWTLRYEDTVDDRIQARVDRNLFEQDESVLSTTLRLDPIDSADPRYYWLRVQMVDDREGPDSENLYTLYAQRRPFTERPLVGFQPFGPPGQPNQNGDVFSPELRDSIISQFINSSEGRQQLAATLTAPLRARMDYQSISRRTFLIDQLPDGANPTYDVSTWERPKWIHVGQWCQKDEDTAQIVKVETLYVEYLLRWSFSEPIRQSIVLFAKEWIPCEAPEPPKNRFARMLQDD